MSTGSHDPVISIVAHDDDPWSALDLNRYHDEDCLSQASSSTTSTGSVPADVFSSHEPTIVTKPTSNDAPHDSFLHMGGWMSNHQAQDQCLRRPKYAKIRLSKNLPYRKKFPIDLHQYGRDLTSTNQEIDLPSESSVEQSLTSQEKGTRL